ncbi:hypothetical protein [Gordonia alkaliphila]|uniref:Uncharacterized protein n=1 Tax=Gordonia alkaliphila TaxID=1053547 RepID=A0ABP8Z1M8_9ACTN
MSETATTADEVGDIRELMGLRTPAAAVMVAFFIATFSLVGLITAPQGRLWPQAVALTLIGVAALGLIRAPSDPLSVPWTAFVALAGPVAGAIVYPQLDVDDLISLQLWPPTAATGLAAYLCVRGRVWSAWASLAATVGLFVVWAEVAGKGVGFALGVTLVNFAPLVMATFFARTIRPAARDIFLLRQASTAEVANQAALRAVREERDRQLLRLDARVRPLLERLAMPQEITPADQLECGLVEAGLRDSLRARALDTPEVLDAAWRARERGVEVVLLDDYGLTGAPTQVRARILENVIPALQDAAQGTVTIRILPPGRQVLATILHADGDHIVRAEYDQKGHLASAR